MTIKCALCMPVFLFAFVGFMSSGYAGEWIRAPSPANAFDFSVGNGDLCYVGVNGQTAGVQGDAACVVASPSPHFETGNSSGQAFPFGFAERVAVGRLGISGKSAVYVASSDSNIYFWNPDVGNGVWGFEATGPSTFAKLPRDQGPADGGLGPLAYQKLVYERYAIGGPGTPATISSFNGATFQPIVVPQDPLWALGADGQVYRESDPPTGPAPRFLQLIPVPANSSGMVPRVISLAYSPSSLAVVAQTEEGRFLRWDDNLGAWLLMTAAPANQVSAGLFAAAPAGISSSFLFAGSDLATTSQSNPALRSQAVFSWFEPSGTTFSLAPSIDSDWVQGVPPVQGNSEAVVSVTEGSLASLQFLDGQAVGGYKAFSGSPLPTTLNGGGSAPGDLLWVLNGNYRIYAYVEQVQLPVGAQCANSSMCASGSCGIVPNFSGVGMCMPNMAQTPQNVPACATAVAGDWVLGCGSVGGGNFGVFQFSPSSGSFVQPQPLPTFGAASITTDLNGDLWLTDASGSVSEWNGSTLTQFSSSSVKASISTAVGSSNFEVWVVQASDHTLWHFNPNPLGRGIPAGWIQIPFPGGGTIQKIAMLSRSPIAPVTSPCNVHVPWVLTSDGRVWAGLATGCNVNVAGAVTFFPVPLSFSPIVDITTDFALDSTGGLWSLDPHTSNGVLVPHSAAGNNRIGATGPYGASSSGAFLLNTATGAVQYLPITP